MEFNVLFLEENTTIREEEEVVTKVKNLLHNLTMIDNVNSYQSGSHLRHMLRAHAWKDEMQNLVDEVKDNIAASRPKLSEMLRGVELMARFVVEGFKD